MAEKPNFNELMEKAQDMQKQMQDIQRQITNMEVVGKAGPVNVLMTGDHRVKRVELKPEAMTQDKEILEDFIAAAFNDASSKIETGTKDKMVKLTKGLQLPDGFDFPTD